MHENDEECPNCHRLTMPKWNEGSLEKARMCSNCKYIQEKENDLTLGRKSMS